MFERKKEKDNLNFQSKKYKMKDQYKSNDLVVANLQYISSSANIEDCPTIETTKQKYIFEKIYEKNKIRYREIFTGFIADSESSGYFDLPYVINITPLSDLLSVKIVPKYGLLLAIDEVNKTETKKYKK